MKLRKYLVTWEIRRRYCFEQAIDCGRRWWGRDAEGQHTQWFTDSRHADLAEAVAAATKLSTDWDRKVRVIDDNEKVHFRMPIGMPQAAQPKETPR